MHDIKWIRDNPDAFDHALKRRGWPPESKNLIAIDERRRATIHRLEQAQARRKAASRECNEAQKAGNEARTRGLMDEVAGLKDTIDELEGQTVALQRELHFGNPSDGSLGLATIPNVPLDDVPDGKDAGDNVEHHRFGVKRYYSFALKQHFDSAGGLVSSCSRRIACASCVSNTATPGTAASAVSTRCAYPA